MKKNTKKQQNAPLGVATNVPLHSCKQCIHFIIGFFEIPLCTYLECEISNPCIICEYLPF